MGETVLGNRYEIIRKIGDGGMAFVYEAKDKLLNRTVALKVLRPEFVDDEEFLTKFKREAEAVASLSHPNIVNVYDVGEDGKVHYIVMEFVDGQNLKEIIQNEGTLDEYTALDITKQIALALGAAHKKGIIHRDIKPHNILISNEGRVVKVADFGIAKAVSNTTVTNIGSVIGSVHYFSPEQAKGKFVTNSADLYSLGIVLYEMLLGKVPFRGDSPISIALQHINDDIEFTADEKVSIPQSVRTLIKKLTEKSASDRYQTAEELIEDIEYIEKNIDLDFIKEYNDFETKKIDPNILNLENKSVSDKLNPTPIPDLEDDYDDYEEEDEDDYEDDDEDYEEESRRSKRRERKKNKKMKKKDSPKTRKRLKVVAVLLLIVLMAQFALAYNFLIKPALGGGDSVAPNLVNMTLDEARTELDKLGVSIKVKGSENSDDVDEDCIISQTPPAGTKLDKGDEVAVIISKGPDSISVPDVVGLTLSDAKEALKESNLKLGTVKYEYSNSEKEGTVLSQSPRSGSSSIKEGDRINLVVSKKSEESNVVDPEDNKTDEENTTQPPVTDDGNSNNSGTGNNNNSGTGNNNNNNGTGNNNNNGTGNNNNNGTGNNNNNGDGSGSSGSGSGGTGGTGGTGTGGSGSTGSGGSGTGGAGAGTDTE